MSRGARVPPEVVDEVEMMWGMDTNLSAAKIFGKLRRKYGPGTIGHRKVQQIIGRLKERGAGRFEPLPWRPWHWERPEDSETSEDTEYLLGLQGKFLTTFRRGLHQHEANWARRLRATLNGTTPNRQLVILRLYFERADVAANLARGYPRTDDLDAILAFRPWKSPAIWEHYVSATEDGLIESPVLEFAVLEEEWTGKVPLCVGTDALLLMLAFSEHNDDYFDDVRGGWSHGLLAENDFSLREDKGSHLLMGLTDDGWVQCRKLLWEGDHGGQNPQEGQG